MRFRFLIVLALWAAIYLPWLGSSGLRSEEPKRVLPAVEMLQTGDYLVPRIAGEPFLRKPPLINWLVAASFKISGARNDWTARLPSVLSVLAIALALLFLMRRDLGEGGAFVAAIACLTSLGMIEKGRIMEIEAVYVALFAFAFLGWLRWWRAGNSSWLTWTVPWIFLGLGLLAKGPALLIFFYALLVAILWQTGKLRALFHPAHFLGLALMLAIFAAWAVPYSRAIQAERISQTWSAEVASRFTGGEIDLAHWSLNFPLGLAYFLPFGLFLPFIRPNELSNDAPIARGLVWGALIPLVAILLLPGALPRYILPTLVPAWVLLGMASRDSAFRWNLSLGRQSFVLSPRIISALAVLIALVALVAYPLRSATTQRAQSIFATVAAAPINAAVPRNETLYAVDVNLQPYLFYVHAPVRYLRTLEEMPLSARYFIVPPGLQNRVSKSPRGARLLARTQGYRGKETLLFAFE